MLGLFYFPEPTGGMRGESVTTLPPFPSSYKIYMGTYHGDRWQNISIGSGVCEKTTTKLLFPGTVSNILHGGCRCLLGQTGIESVENKSSSVWFICLFGVLCRFQHCTGHITTGSWKGRGNQYI